MVKFITKTLGEVTSIMTKGIAPKYVDVASDNTIIVLNQKCNRDFSISLRQARLNDCSKKAIPQDRILKKFDVLINSTGTGTAGRVAQLFDITEPMTIDGHMILIRPTDEIDPIYYGYAVKAHHAEIEQLAEGSTGQTEINRKRLSSEIIISFPAELDKQRQISRFLYHIDQKIWNNKAINDNLEQQAMALYGKFFPYAVTDELPAGWRVGTVGEIVEIHDSKRIPLSGAQRAKMEKRIYPYYGAASLMDYVDEYIFDGKYLLLGEDGTVVDDAGYPILQYVWGKFWVNNHAHILTGRLGHSVESLLLLFKRTPVKSIVTGAVQPKISQANLRSVQVVIPPHNEMDIFNKLIYPLFDQIRQNQDQNKALAALRDALLPRLMSGEIDVSDIQF